MNTNKVRVNVAVDHRSKLDVSGTHITTNNFMLLKPVYYRHMLPSESIHGNEHAEVRMQPLASPTWGKCRLNIRNFFVPYRQVFPNWDSFYYDTIGVNYNNASLVSDVPKFANDTFVKWFMSYSGAYGSLCIQKTLTVTDTTYDFMYVNGNTTEYYVLTYIGRNVLSILYGLGYRINWNDTDQTNYNALGLLCYAKVFTDWYANSQYLNSSEYINIQKLFKYNNPTSGLVLVGSDFETILFFTMFVLYDGQNEYITNAWDNPIAPNVGVGSVNFSVTDITTPGNTAANIISVHQTAEGTPFMKQGSSGSNNIGTQYIHDMLKQLTDYVKRHQLVGAREAERALAAFGINLDSTKVNRSIFISTHTQDIEIGAVMSNADTGTNISNLGDYAGAGYGQMSDEIDFQTDEFGMFIAVSSILPDSGIYQGIDRNNLHLDKSEFFIPEFDAAGVQSIAKREAYMSANGNFGTGSQYDESFGYCPRYSEYKVGRNFLTGLFLSPTSMVDVDNWHLFRQFKDIYFGNDIANLHHSMNFTRGTDATQYSRIFTDTSTDYDKFFMVFHFALQAISPCRSLFDSYDFDSNGKEILLQSNGTKLN